MAGPGRLLDPDGFLRERHVPGALRDWFGREPHLPFAPSNASNGCEMVVLHPIL